MIENEISQAEKKRPAHRILVADDEPGILNLNTEVLVESGYNVDAAVDGAVAWDNLKVNTYHLLITDNVMPKVTGVELLKKLHDAEISLPVIMATGTWPDEEFASFPALQIPVKLLKPYTIMELLGAVKKILSAPGGDRTTA
jgi:two-component system alkaline phosphatase synthesis response regulator PhoP